MPGGEAESAWEMSQAMDASRTDCTLHLCIWHAAEAIKKKLIKAGSYPLEIRWELTGLDSIFLLGSSGKKTDKSSFKSLIQLKRSVQKSKI